MLRGLRRPMPSFRRCRRGLPFWEISCQSWRLPLQGSSFTSNFWWAASARESWSFNGSPRNSFRRQRMPWTSYACPRPSISEIYTQVSSRSSRRRFRVETASWSKAWARSARSRLRSSLYFNSKSSICSGKSISRRSFREILCTILQIIRKLNTRLRFVTLKNALGLQSWSVTYSNKKLTSCSKSRKSNHRKRKKQKRLFKRRSNNRCRRFPEPTELSQCTSGTCRRRLPQQRWLSTTSSTTPFISITRSTWRLETSMPSSDWFSRTRRTNQQSQPLALGPTFIIPRQWSMRIGCGRFRKLQTPWRWASPAASTANRP